MSTENNLEVHGNIFEHPFGELIAEIMQSKLSGSLRLAHAEQKIIVYFNSGDLIFAVSNSRVHRIFHLLLNSGKITSQQLSGIPNFSNDQELKVNLIRDGILTSGQMNEVFSIQIKQIVESALGWSDGKWIFSPLVQLKSGINFRVDLPDLLFALARQMPTEKVVRRFKSLQERFAMKAQIPSGISLLPQEAFVCSRFEGENYSIEEITTLSGLSEAETLKTLYILWLGGFLIRQKWNSAIKSDALSAILSARLELKSKAFIPTPAQKNAAEEKPVVEETKTEKTVKADATITLEEYLERAKKAANYYEILGISTDADAAQVKSAYFQLAKRFHPDLFYRRVEDELHKRIQTAFTVLAQAYETLRKPESREVYDFKIQKEIANLSKRVKKDTEQQTPVEIMEEQAAESFDHGFDLIMEEEYEEALPYLARAVHLIGGNAKYRAYYGRALSADQKTFRQAEAELQAALRIEPDNADYRLMIAELFIRIGLNKRAEGELNRILQKSPNHREAKSMLDSLQNK